MKWWARIITVLFFVALGWMFLSPPTVAIDIDASNGSVHDRLICEALGLGDVDLSPMNGQISQKRYETLEKYLVARGHVDEDGELADGFINDAEAAAQSLCDASRQNRQTAMLVSSVVFLTALVWWRTRRSPNSLRPTGIDIREASREA